MPHVDTPHSLCRFGIARGDVTPPVGIYHRMWGAATHERATGVHRPLTATTIAFQPARRAGGDHTTDPTSETGHVIVALDHCMLGDQDLPLVRERDSAVTNFRPGRVHI